MTWPGLGPSGQVWAINPDGSFGRVDWQEINGDASGVVTDLLVIGLQGNEISPAVPSLNDVLTWDGLRWTPISPSAGTGLVHNLLSATHPDTTPASPQANDIIIGSGSSWRRFPVGQVNTFLSVNTSGNLEWRDPNVVTPTIMVTGSSINLPDANVRLIVSKASGSPTQVNLPSNPVLGQEVLVKDGKGDSNTNHITVLPASGVTVDGLTGVLLTQNYQSYTFLYNGTEWNVI